MDMHSFRSVKAFLNLWQSLWKFLLRCSPRVRLASRVSTNFCIGLPFIENLLSFFAFLYLVKISNISGLILLAHYTWRVNNQISAQ